MLDTTTKEIARLVDSSSFGGIWERTAGCREVIRESDLKPCKGRGYLKRSSRNRAGVVEVPDRLGGGQSCPPSHHQETRYMLKRLAKD